MKKRPLDALFLWCAHIAYVIFDILYVCGFFFLLLQICGNTALVRCSHTQDGLKIECGIMDRHGSDFPSFL